MVEAEGVATTETLQSSPVYGFEAMRGQQVSGPRPAVILPPRWRVRLKLGMRVSPGTCGGRDPGCNDRHAHESICLGLNMFPMH